jgi:dipeptidyl aminopeptidase/acylaminoacyl peptidase
MGFPKNGRANIIWKASAGNCKLLGQIPHVLVRQIAAIDNSQAWIVGQSLVLSTMDEKTKDCGFYKMDVNTGAVEKIIEEKAYFAASPFSINVSKSGKTIAYVRQSPSEPTDVWVASEKLSDHRKVSELNSSMKDVCFGKCRILSFTGKGGKRLNAALLLPGNYKEGQKFPLIVHVYGGMFLSEDVNCFGLSRLNEGVDNWQLYASRGYAVLQPDILINKGTPVDDIVHSIRASIASVLATGMIDSKRIGLIGHSYGAYSTLSLITRSDLFSAAVACSGPADLVSAYGNLDNDSTGWAESGQGNMLGTPWQFRERYIKNSPVFFLDRVQTPLLLVHGEADRTISCKQSEEVFVGLRRLGREVEYARYPGEAHWPGGWGYTNQVDYLNRVIEWFDKHLKADLK